MNSKGVRGDIVFIVVVSIFLILLTSIPYFWGYLGTPPGKRFLGFVGRDVPGSYMYLMWEVQSQEGRNLFQDRLTPEVNPPFYFNPEWWLLGRFQRYSGLTLRAGFQVERSATIFLGCFILYYFLSCFFTSTVEKRLMMLWILFTSGLGWIFVAIKQWTGISWPIRLWDVNGINLFGYLINKPHFIRSLMLVCLIYALLLKGEAKDSRKYFLAAGLAIIAQGFIRPYDLPVIFLLLLIFPVLISVQEGHVSARRIKNYLITALTGFPIVAYYLFMRYLSIFKGVWKGVNLQSPTPLELVIWLGFPFLLALVGFTGIRNLKDLKKPQMFLYLWGILVLLLIYSYPLIPWGTESAGLCYVMAPILSGLLVFNELIPSFLATERGQRVATKLGLDRAKFVVLAGVFLIVVCIPSNFVLLSDIKQSLAEHSRPYYLQKKTLDAFAWLAKHADNQDVVLSSANDGYLLSALSRVRVFVGHHDFTVDFDRKNQLLEDFFNVHRGDDFRKELLRKYRITYVFYGRMERGLGAFDPKDAVFLRQVFQNGSASIYKVVRSALSNQRTFGQKTSSHGSGHDGHIPCRTGGG